MSELNIIAKIVAKKEAAEKVEKELSTLVEPTRKEEGCIDYSFHRDNADPATFVFYERWESPEHLKAHMNTEHFKRCMAAIDGLTEDTVIQELTRLS